MSELDVVVIHVRAEQAAEYERLFAERVLSRWREHKARGAFLSARISKVAFGTDDRRDVIKYVIAVEVPSQPRTASMTPIPVSRSSTVSRTSCSLKTRWSPAERCCTPSGQREPRPGDVEGCRGPAGAGHERAGAAAGT